MHKKIFIALTALTLMNSVNAETESKNASSPTPSVAETKVAPEVDLLLNGIVLDKDLLEYRVQLAVQNGQVDSKELRLSIRDELYNRALIMEEAKRIGFTKNKAIKLMAQDAQENIYIDLVLQEYFKNHPITDELLKAEYDRQIKLLGPKHTIVEYHLATIAVADEDKAKELIQKSKKESFAQLAADHSVDPSGPRGGDLGWINASQMHPSFRAVVANIPKGNITAAPIQMGNVWQVIRVLDRREGKPAPFEQSKDRLKQAVIQNIKNDYIQELREAHIKNKNEK